MKATQHEGTVAGVVADAFSELEALGEEMRESFDNTPESLQNGGVGEMRGEAADALEGLSEPSIEGPSGELPVVYMQQHKRRESRSFRRDNAVTMLESAKDVLEREQERQRPDGEDDDLSAMIEDIQMLIDEAEGVTFPGMFG